MRNANIDTAPIVKRYRTWASITIGAIVLLILAGGIVRMTGSGMGCPDWPKCFGQWVPPTDISQLPTDYKARFEVAGREIADFEAFKTWVEYINRLLGVLVGIFSIITVVLSVNLRKIIPPVFYLSVVGLLLVIIEGGIGAYVVRTHLQVGMVTLHMLVALLIFAVYLSAILKSQEATLKSKYIPNLPRKYTALALVLLSLTTVQILMGTQVREAIDEIALRLGESQRQGWIAELGSVYDWHSLFYYSILGVFVWMVIRMKDHLSAYRPIRTWLIAIGLGICIEAAVGIGMHYFGIPASLQPIHLLLASLLFGAEFLLLGTLWMLKENKASEDKEYDPQRNKEILVH